MTDLRDPRLRKALDHAPDAGLRPGAATREAIRDAAHAALQPAWRRWWTASGERRSWTAAFATVLLAGIVTLLWRGEDVQQVRREAESVVPAAPVVAPQPSPEPVAPSAAPVAPVPPVIPAPEAAPVPAAPPAAERRPALQDAQRSRQERARRAEEASLAQDRAREKAAAQAPPPPRAAAAPAVRQPAPAARPREDWTQVRIEADGASRVIPREQAGRLPELVGRALAAPWEPALGVITVELSLEVAQADEPLGLLEWNGNRWRWTPLRDALQARWAEMEPAQAQELLQEAQRLLQR